MMSWRRLALLVEYEGTAYNGSQYQENSRTVQGALERALSSLTSEPIRVRMAGRTDAGVHALGQVASFATTSRHDVETFVRGANALLPKDISVRAGAEVPVDFDPRRHAASRRYRYKFHLGPRRPALSRNFVWHVGAALDIGAISKAAAALVGRHDFAAFTSPSESRRGSTERDVFATCIRRQDALTVLDIEANAFLQHMVRRIAGSLVEVGAGRLNVAQFEALVSEARPGAANKMAPARGLCLVKVRYGSGLFEDENNEDI